MIDITIKSTFFDRKAVIDATDRATRQALSRAGAFIRTSAKHSIRHRKGISQPGGVPFSHEGSLRRLGIGVAGYGGVVFTPSEGDDSLAGFQSRVALKGVKPQPATHGGRFVVTQEPIANGAIGRACISGVTICQVTGSGSCADVDKDVTDSLKMGGTGCEVLWWDSGASKRWAVVRLGTMTPRVQQFKVTGMGGDWVVGKMWDGTTLDTNEVSIAKPYQLRRTPFEGKTYLGYTVAYTDNTTRTLTSTMTDGGTCPPETQIVIPGYTWNIADDQKDVIYAIGPVGGGVGVNDGNGTPLTWLDLNVDGRAWTEKFTE